MTDYHEKYYLAALKQFESGKRNEALWAKALTQAEGDEAVAKYKYVALFVERLALRTEAKEAVMTSPGDKGGRAGQPGEALEDADGANAPRFFDPRLHAPDNAEGLRAEGNREESGNVGVDPERADAEGDARPEPDRETPPVADQRDQAAASNLQLIYILYFVGSFVLGISTVIGLVMAYVNNDPDLPGWAKSHYKMLISLFWWGLIFILVISLVFSISAPLGGILLLGFLVWLIVVLAKGMKALARREVAPYFQ